VVRMTRKLLASRPSSRPNEASGFRVSHTCWWLGVAKPGCCSKLCSARSAGASEKVDERQDFTLLET
jgi:hypothetical protein